MIALLIALAALFAWAVFASAAVIVERAKLSGQLVAKQTELDSYKKVGQWYEKRVADLENESRALAEQLVASGSVVRHAMPLPQPEEYKEYAYDPTGLVREQLDARDLPVG